MNHYFFKEKWDLKYVIGTSRCVFPIMLELHTLMNLLILKRRPPYSKQHSVQPKKTSLSKDIPEASSPEVKRKPIRICFISSLGCQMGNYG